MFDIQGVSNNGAGKFSLKSNGQTGKISIVCIGKIVGGDHYLIMLRAFDRDMTDSSRRQVHILRKLVKMYFSKKFCYLQKNVS